MAKAAVDRLKKEYMRLLKAPLPHIEAHPLESDILQWHYVISGPADSPYAGGLYHGKVVFPREYPFKPPSIYMHTPSGRFKPDTSLCLSMSAYHPESWNPLWSVGSILQGLLSFMLETTPTLGSVESSDETKREYARRSREYNRNNPIYRKLFPHYLVENEEAAAASTTPAKPAQAAAAPAAADAALRRRGGADSAAVAPAAAAVAAVPAPAAATPAAGPTAVAAAATSAPHDPAVLSLLGGRVRIRRDQLFDHAMTLLVLGALGVAAALFFGKRKE